MAASTPRPPFVKQLVLTRHFARAFGLSYDWLLKRLAETEAGKAADGASYFCHVLEAVAGRSISDVDLRRYDANIRRHEARIGRRRGGSGSGNGGGSGSSGSGSGAGTPAFQLTYFQYLACLFTECYLDQLTRDRRALLAALEATRAELAPHLPPYREDELAKLAIFMSIGAGKTLVMHINLLQFLDYKPFPAGKAPDSILLITPGEELSRQHREELEKSDLAFMGVEIREITKLYVPDKGARNKGGESIAVDQFKGPNLLLVDEGHKGTKGDDSTERAWRAIREALAGGDDRFSIKPGFTFEYSATFAQMAALDASLSDAYAKAAIIEFAYGRFWKDGYGKDFRVLNAQTGAHADSQATTDLVLAAGLLAFYQQTHWYDANTHVARQWRLEAPLAVFLGSKVATDGSDVATVVKFLARVAAEPTWFAGLADKVLSISGVQQTLNGDPLDFSYLRALNETGSATATSVAQKLFGGSGQLIATRVNENEVGLRAAGASDDRYFGVINVGDARKVHEALVVLGCDDGGEDKLTSSLFAAIDRSPNIKVLIGAKRFIEGWSSWRVAAMGLVNVGKSEGSQIVQMFGRGVRLLGKRGDLKRSGLDTLDDVPEHLPLLERLMVFGIKADYMQRFLESLEREGARRTIIEAPVTVAADWHAKNLMTLASDGNFAVVPIAFIATDAEAYFTKIEASLSLTSGVGSAQTVRVEALTRHQLSATPADIEAIRLAAQEAKRRNGWWNMEVAVGELARYASERVSVEAPVDYFDGHIGRLRWRDVLSVAIEEAMSSQYRRQARTFYASKLKPTLLDSNDANFPLVNDANGQRRVYLLEIEAANEVAKSAIETLTREVGNRVPAATLDAIRKRLEQDIGLGDVVAAVEKVLASAAYAMPNDDLSLPLPRLYAPQHLYAPLLVSRPVVIKGDQLGFDFESAGSIGFRATPPLLEESEARFVWDLRRTWQEHCHAPCFEDVSIYLLRNLPHRGVGFFRVSGFFPDFMLWMTRDNLQVLAFVEPKGIARKWPGEKLDALRELKLLQLSIPLRGYLVTPSDKDELLSARPTSYEGLSSDIFFQQDQQYVLDILQDMRKALT
ncbi:MAG: hypothetical protein ING64_03680 [Rhodocyclaceae bacterium]|nr:hypothetical protein [Rhodocyclaceae bacterium]MCA3023142.1 hypothetical protein [Rhodocyclaceae bacterium]MCA3054090.1 hypothetical protein [Rhodocyclaceae bacterium]MCA3055457.1 hypothetical protein [Rhodocyclaceae bacterium]